VDDAEAAPGERTDEAAFLALDGDARVVGDFLAAAGETIEECGLAAIRHADQGETQKRRGQCRGRGGVHGVGVRRDSSTQTPCASRRRSARVVWPTRTTNGSRPGRASARISISSPLTKPN